MRSTIKTLSGGTVGVIAGEHGEFIALGVSDGRNVEAIALTPSEAALLAGEIERAVWAAQRASIPSGLRGPDLMAAAVAAQAMEDAGHLGVDL